MSTQGFKVPLRRVDEFDPLIDPYYREALCGGKEGQKARARLESLRDHLNQLLRSLDEPAPKRLANRALYRMYMIRAQHATSGDSALDKRIRGLPILTRETIKSWVREGWLLVLKDETRKPGDLRRAGRTGRLAAIRKRETKLRDTISTAKRRHALSGVPPEALPEWRRLKAMAKTVETEGLDYARREFAKYAQRNWVKIRGGNVTRVSPPTFGSPAFT